MIDESEAEKALDFLRESAAKVLPICQQAREKAHKLKWVEALLVKGQSNQGTPISVRKEHARADQRYIDAANEEAIAFAEWTSLQERRDAARITISLYQSQVKDRL